MLAGKKVLIAVTGSIAAYKIPFLVRLLVKEQVQVKVIMTPAATAFVSPLTLATLSKNKVEVDMFTDGVWSNHVELGRWADLMLLAPLSCNTLSKMATGACDNLVMATYLSAMCPVMAAPAMDEDMWKHATTRQNIETIQKSGCRVVPVGHGELASGLVGDGRMAEIEELFAKIKDFFFESQRLKGKKVLVTAGPTYEPIDPVRFIGNYSSGKMGYALAACLVTAGADVTLVSGPVAEKPANGVQLISVGTAEEMYNNCIDREFDIAVMAAAVADYRPLEKADQKIKKKEQNFTLTLTKNPDILKALGAAKKPGQLLVGFALETGNEKSNALEKLKSKNADMVIMNSLNDAGAGFGADTNKITIYYRNGEEKSFPLKSKTEVAKDIVNSIIEMLP